MFALNIRLLDFWFSVLQKFRTCSFFFWSLYCLFFFDIQILITPLVSFVHCVVCSSLIYRFWLPLWYLLVIVLSVLLWYTDSDYPFGIFWSLCCLFFFDIHILITSLWYLRYTDSDYPFGILDIQILITSLWYLQALLTL